MPNCLNVTFSESEVRNVQRASDAIDELSCSSPSERFRFLSLGRYDQMILTVSDSADELFKADDHLNSDGYTHHHVSFYGRLLSFSSDKQWAELLEERGIVGVVSLKLAATYREGFDSEDRNRIIALEITSRLKKLNVDWAFYSMTGWEDYSVIILSRNFHSLFGALAELRAMKGEILPNFGEGRQIHLFNTSCTQVALNLGEHLNSSDPVSVDRLEDRFDLDSSLGWAVRMEVKPGHLSGVVRDLDAILDGRLEKIDYYRIVRQSDLRCSPRNSEIRELLIFYMLFFSSKLSGEKTSIRTVDTHLHSEIDTKKLLKESNSLTKKGTFSFVADSCELTKAIEDACLSLRIPVHTIKALKQLSQKIENLAGSEFVGYEFKQVLSVFDQFLIRLELSANALIEKGKKCKGIQKLKEQERNLSEDITNWTHAFERVLSDRYRGAYPMGEAISMRLSTYYSSHHKHLAICDFFGNSSTALFLDLISRRRRDAGLSQERMIELKIVCFLGSSPNFWCNTQSIRFFGTSFIDLPSDSDFYNDELTVVAHEVGHHATIAYLLHSKNVNYLQRGKLGEELERLMSTRLNHRQQEVISHYLEVKETFLHNIPDLKNYLKEILAELFSLSLCSGGDFVKHRQVSFNVLNRMFPGIKGDPSSPANRVRTDLNLTMICRLMASASIYHSIRKVLEGNKPEKYYCFGFKEAFIRNWSNLDDEMKNNVIVNFSGENGKNMHAMICDALDVLDLLCRRAGFRCFLLAIFDLGESNQKFINGSIQNHASLESYRDMMRLSQKRDLSGNLEHIDKIFYSI